MIAIWKQYHLLLALLVGSLSGLWFAFNSVTVGCFLTVISIICYQKSWSLMRCVCILIIVFSCYFGARSYALYQQEKLTYPKQNTILILPDQYQVDGNQLSGVATVSGKSISFYYQLKSPAEQTFWQSNNQALSVKIVGKTSRIAGATNQYQFDYRQFSKVHWRTHQVTIDEIKNIKPTRPFLSVFNQLHKKVNDWVDQSPDALRGYAKALLLGEKERDFFSEHQGIQTMGLLHLFSISGFHMAFLANVAYVLLRRLRLLKEAAAILVVVLMVSFFMFCGHEPVVLRPLLVAIFTSLVALKIMRKNRYLFWSLSLVICLIYEPQLLLRLGGQLSFLLTFTLLFIDRFSGIIQNVILAIVSMPVIVYTQFRWHLFDAVVNFAAIPVFELWVIPITLIGLISQLLNISQLAMISSYLLDQFATMIDWLATQPGLLVIGQPPNWMIILLTGGCLLLTIRYWKVRLFGALMVMVLGAGHLYGQGHQSSEYVQFDIGQGDAALYKIANNQSVHLIDTGGKVSFGAVKNWQEKRHQTSGGKNIIVNYLWANGINTIDALWLTHQDMDHIGYAKDILQNMTVKQIIMPAGMRQTTGYQREIQPFVQSTTQVREVTDQHFVNKNIQILGPTQPGKASNEDGLALNIQLGSMQIFSAGDLDIVGEENIMITYPKYHPDILKVGHHGSKTSTSNQLLTQWQPKLAIISAGKNNRYHHPHQEVIQKIQDQRISILNTQEHGMIKLIHNQKIVIKTYQKP